MANLNPYVLIEMLIVFFKYAISFLEVWNKFKRTGLSELSKSMNSCCFLILLSDLMGYNIWLFLVFRVRIKTKLFLLLFLWLAWSNNNRNEIIKDKFESISNGISNKIKICKCSLFNFRLFLVLKQYIDLFHCSHYVSLVE